MSRDLPCWVFPALAALLLVLGALVMIQRTLQVATPAHGDQAAYLELAINLHEGQGFVSHFLSAWRPYPEITRVESVRAPLYPLLLAPFAERHPDFFTTARFVTLFMSLTGAALLGWMVGRRHGWAVAAVFLGLLLANSHFLVYATELWCENLLMVLAFVAGWFWWHEGERPVRRGILAGVFAGLALLTKKVLLPLVAIVLLVEAAGWLVARRRDGEKESAGWKPLAALAVAFGITILPYVAYNLATEGSLFNNVDVSAVLWIDHGPRDAWQIAEELPTARAYLDRHGWGFVFRKIGTGMVNEIWIFAALGDLEILGGRPSPGWVLWPLAAVAFLPVCRRRPVKATALAGVILFFFLMFSWYQHIDTTPRFVYLLLPVMLLGAVLGVKQIAQRLAEERAVHMFLLALAIPLALNLAMLIRPAAWEAEPIPFPQAEALQTLKGHLPEDAVLATGPSHWFPYLWLFPNKVMFVPAIDDFKQFVKYMERFDAEYLFLDPETYHRRRPLFDPVMGQGTAPPGFEVVASAPDFVLMRRVEAADGD